MRRRLALLAVAAMLCDLAAYQLALAAVGPAGELNPVAGWLGAGLPAAKLAQALAAAAIAWWLAGRPRRRVRAMAYLPGVAGLAGATTAVLTIWRI